MKRELKRECRTKTTTLQTPRGRPGEGKAMRKCEEKKEVENNEEKEKRAVGYEEKTRLNYFQG